MLYLTSAGLHCNKQALTMPPYVSMPWNIHFPSQSPDIQTTAMSPCQVWRPLHFSASQTTWTILLTQGNIWLVLGSFWVQRASWSFLRTFCLHQGNALWWSFLPLRTQRGSGEQKPCTLHICPFVHISVDIFCLYSLLQVVSHVTGASIAKGMLCPSCSSDNQALWWYWWLEKWGSEHWWLGLWE